MPGPKVVPVVAAREVEVELVPKERAIVVKTSRVAVELVVALPLAVERMVVMARMVMEVVAEVVAVKVVLRRNKPTDN